MRGGRASPAGPARVRVLGAILDPGGHLPAGRASVRDAVGDPDAAEAAAREEHAGMPRERPIDGGDAVQMADLVLRVAAVPAIHAREQRLAAPARERVAG